MKFGVIDIGSNSVRLMMWADGTTLYKHVITTRLGEGIEGRPVLREEAMERTARAVADCAERAAREGADAVCAFATAAVRRAENGGEFCARVRALCGLDVDVVSGEEEAMLGLSGALGEADGGIVDIGGASTEVCVRRGGKIVFSVSMDVGAVRLYDRCGQDEAALSAHIGPVLSALEGCPEKIRVYAVGGTATTVSALLQALPVYDPHKIQDHCMTAEAVKALAGRLLHLPADARRALPGMDVKRADIIGGGTLLLSRIMEKLRLDCVYASDRDNQEGYVIRRLLK